MLSCTAESESKAESYPILIYTASSGFWDTETCPPNFFNLNPIEIYVNPTNRQSLDVGEPVTTLCHLRRRLRAARPSLSAHMLHDLVGLQALSCSDLSVKSSGGYTDVELKRPGYQWCFYWTEKA